MLVIGNKVELNIFVFDVAPVANDKITDHS